MSKDDRSDIDSSSDEEIHSSCSKNPSQTLKPKDGSHTGILNGDSHDHWVTREDIMWLVFTSFCACETHCVTLTSWREVNFFFLFFFHLWRFAESKWRGLDHVWIMDLALSYLTLCQVYTVSCLHLLQKRRQKKCFITIVPAVYTSLHVCALKVRNGAYTHKYKSQNTFYTCKYILLQIGNIFYRCKTNHCICLTELLLTLL